MKNTRRKIFVTVAMSTLVIAARAADKKPAAEKASAANANVCFRCDDLKKIEFEISAEEKKIKPNFDALQLRATAVIQKMADAKSHLTDEQVAEVVRAFNASIPTDPAQAIVDNNIDLVKANRAAFDREIAKLPKAQGKEIHDAIEIVLGVEQVGNDPDAPKN